MDKPMACFQFIHIVRRLGFSKILAFEIHNLTLDNFSLRQMIIRDEIGYFGWKILRNKYPCGVTIGFLSLN